MLANPCMEARGSDRLDGADSDRKAVPGCVQQRSRSHDGRARPQVRRWTFAQLRDDVVSLVTPSLPEAKIALCGAFIGTVPVSGASERSLEFLGALDRASGRQRNRDPRLARPGAPAGLTEADQW